MLPQVHYTKSQKNYSTKSHCNTQGYKFNKSLYIDHFKKSIQFLYILTYLLTYLLTPWRRVLSEQLTGLHLVKKFPAFHGTRRFITALTNVRHLSLSWASIFTYLHILYSVLTLQTTVTVNTGASYILLYLPL